MKRLSITLLFSTIVVTSFVKAADGQQGDVRGQLLSAGCLTLASIGANRIGQLTQATVGEDASWAAAGVGALFLFDDASEKLVKPNAITRNMPMGLGERPFLINASIAAALVYGARLGVQTACGVSTDLSKAFYKNVLVGAGVLLGLNKVYAFLSKKA